MSYILDALRKSQQARQPGTAPRTGAVHDISPALPAGRWWLALGVVLLFGIVAAALWLWRGTVANLPEPPPASAPGGPAATAPVAEPAAAATPMAAPETIVAKTVAVADLAEQAKVPAPATPPKKILVARPAKKPAASPRPEAARTAAAPPALPLLEDHTPLLQQMPAEFQRALPPLAVTIHVYSHDESQRILFINNREYRRGSRIDGGIRVEEIVPDGAVLSFRGERFKLSRPR